MEVLNIQSHAPSRHPVDGSRGRLKSWLISLNVDRFRDPPGPVIFFDKNLLIPRATARRLLIQIVYMGPYIKKYRRKTINLEGKFTVNSWEIDIDKSLYFKSSDVLYVPVSDT